MKVANKDICSMDQPHWESEALHGAANSGMDSGNESETHIETFYVALKLALARLKEYSAATTG